MKISIQNRIIIGFLILLVLMVAQFIFSSLITGKQSALLEQIHNVQSTSVQLSNMSVEGQKMRRYEKEYFIYVNNDEKRTKYYNEWQEAGRSIGVSLNGIQDDKNQEWTAQDKAGSSEWLKALHKYTEVMQTLNNRVISGSINTTLDSNSAIKDGKNAFRAYLGGTSKSFNTKLVESDALLAKYSELINSSNLALLVIFAISVIVAILCVLIISRSINSQVKGLTDSLAKMASGNFKEAIVKPKSPELLKIGTGLEMLRKSTHILLDKTNSRGVEINQLKAQLQERQQD